MTTFYEIIMIYCSRKFCSACFLASFFFFLFTSPCAALSDEEIGRTQKVLQGKPVGDRIALWAETFIGTPYDEDPQGAYVTQATIVADEKVDCMYLTFRSVELAFSNTPEEAVQVALEKRFHTRGRIQDGKVINYEDRYEYGEDMIRIGKWGREITSQLGRTTRIKGSRGIEFWEILPKKELVKGMSKLKSGDLIFFIKSPKKRLIGESVGHIGFIKVEESLIKKNFYLIHAGGSKNKGGGVKKIPLAEYVAKMGFIGVQVTRFE
jgi:hypothetical protein